MSKRMIACTAALLLLSSCWKDKECDQQNCMQEPATAQQDDGFLRVERPEDTDFGANQEEKYPIRMDS